MKKMKTSLAIAIALAAGVSTSVFAQNVKEGTISFALTAQQQSSVSETAAANAGSWVDPVTGRGPTHYRTATTKINQATLIKDIAYVLHGNAAYYGSSAKLVLVQGELSGFFNMTPDLSNSVPEVAEGGLDGYIDTSDLNTSTSIANSTDGLAALLDSGRHFETNPITGQYPVGHLQPWGQIYVKYIVDKVDYCDNVTFFFGLTVQECYDCFYLNSFISDATFTFKNIGHPQSGPPCCNIGTNSVLQGNGRDHYYLTLSFDDTVNNPYLNASNALLYVGVAGISPSLSPADGITPDVASYANTITSRLGSPSPYETRFTLNGILTYDWSLKFINTSDLYPDFIGTAGYVANGYGFVQLYCTLLTGSASITESIIKASACCDDENGTDPWYDNFPSDNSFGGWYSIGDYTDSDNTGVLNSLNQNVYFEWLGFTPSTPFNTGANLSYHANFNENYTPWVTQTTPEPVVAE